MPNKPSIPFSEPPYLAGLPSPYYSSSHLKWQKACRAFIDENLNQYAMDWEREEKVPPEVFQKFAAANMLIPTLPAPLPVDWLKRLGVHDILGTVKVEDWDYLHTAIYTDEMSRSGLSGPSASLTTGMSYGVPPIIKFGSNDLQERFLPDLLLGKKRICIAITEPDAGSDVANIQTTAAKTDDGKHYIVNGTKKWITNGIWSAYATMAVRTSGHGPGGLSLLVVPLLDHPGVSMRPIKCSGQTSGGTTYIELDDVRVPVSNLIGQEGLGMKYIMTNFNHERLTIAIGVTRGARVALAAAFEYCLKREAFGKTLMDQPVVRHRLAKCGAMLESQWAWIEQFVYQMTKLSKAEADVELGGLTALAKAQAGIVLDECARCAVLLFGGNGYTKTGQGEIVERIYRDVPGARIPGGSEDVLLDLSLSTESLLALSLTSKFFSVRNKKYIYHTVKFPCTAGSLKASKELHQRLIQDRNLALLVKRLEFGKERKANRILLKMVYHVFPNLQDLLEKLPNLRRLVCRLHTTFDKTVTNFIARCLPQLEVMLDHPLVTYGQNHAMLQAIQCSTHCAMKIFCLSFNDVQIGCETLRGFNHLQHLELEVRGGLKYLTEIQCQQLKGCIDLVLSRLKYLSIPGRLKYAAYNIAPLLFMNSSKEPDLSRLERLEVMDIRTCVGLIQNPTLTGLKYLLYRRPSPKTMPVEAREMQDLLCRNEELEELHIIDWTKCSDLFSLSPLGPSLHTLDFHNGSSELGISQFATLASLLPNLANLSASVEHDATWPYTSLAAVADSFPKIQYLHLRTIQQCLCKCCNLVLKIPWDWPVDDVIPKIPGTTLDLASKSWQYFWDVLVKRNARFVPQGNDSAIHPSFSPRIKSLVFTTVTGSSGRGGSDSNELDLDYYHHTFRVDRSERLEDSRSGIATVSSQTVEEFETDLRDCALRTSKDFYVNSVEEVLELRWVYRKVSEWGYDKSVWPDIRPEELSPGFGRPRLVVPGRIVDGADYHAANAVFESLGLLAFDETSDAVYGLKG
ncbi:hypothetical protein MMC27_000725 [Xylographa pallens]|nr:hypothetical protein [Xylographa pallens]